jgi:hypothetical protein
MSNGTTPPPATSLVPLSLACAPFPEGFQGDMDETFQQFCALAEAYIEGNFLTGLVLPPGSTLPTSDLGPIAMGGSWYFWDTGSSQYLPQSSSMKVAKNFAKNCTYQVRQYSVATVPSGVTKVCDMALARSTAASVLATSQVTGPLAGANNDYCQSAITYTVGPTLVPTLGATDLYCHEHLIEGADIAAIQGQSLALSFWVWVNTPGTYSVYLVSTGRDASYVANFNVPTASTWTRISVTDIPPLPTGMGTWNFGEGQTGLYIGVVMATGTQWQATAAQLNKWNQAFFAGSAQNNNFCTVVNNQIYITGIKLEASTVATYLSVPSFDADLWDCLRYYYTTFTYQSVTAGVPIQATAYAAAAVILSHMFPRRMAKVPNVVPYGFNSHAAGNITNISTGTDIANATVGATQKGVLAYPTATGATAGQVFATIIIADARLS